MQEEAWNGFRRRSVYAEESAAETNIAGSLALGIDIGGGMGQTGSHARLRNLGEPTMT